MAARPLRPTEPDLFGALAPSMPDGFDYRPDLLTADEEQALVARLGELPFKPFDFHGFLAKRRVVYFGWRYDFDAGRVDPIEPIPDFLLPVRERAAGLLGVAPADLPHALINEYAPGAGIGWHRDRPQFGEVVGVSLVSPCTLRLRLKEGARWRRASILAAPRSAYALRGPARTEWEHSIPPVDGLRYSVTFRTIRQRSPRSSARPA